MRATVICVIVSATIGAGLCWAQITPVVAKQREIEEVLDSEGNVVSHTETLGRYLRNSAGSVATQTYSTIDGESAVRSGQLEDYGRHKIYQLNYKKHEAVELADLPDGPHPEYMENAKTALGRETINGLPCLIHSSYLVVNGKKSLIGKVYDSAEYGFHVKEDAIFQLPGGPRSHRIVELYDIKFVDPDPNDFDLEKFSFLGKGPAACVKPGASVSQESLQ